MGGQRLEHGGVAGQRVARHVEAEHLLFLGQPLDVGQLGDVGQARDGAGGVGLAVAVAVAVAVGVTVGGGRGEHLEEAALAALAVLLRGLPGLRGAGRTASHWLRRAPRWSNAPALISASTQAWLTVPCGDALEQVVEPGERPALAAGLDDRVDGLAADPLDRRQAEMDLPLVGDPELRLPLVDVRRQDLDPHPPAVVDVLDEVLLALGAVHLRREQGGHELGRVVRLEVGRLEGDEGVRRGVRLVEPVAAEELDQVEDLLGLRLLQAPADAPLDELLAPLRDHLRLLLRDRLDAGVGLRQLDPAEPVEDAHHLFLVDHHPVGLFQDVLHHRVRVARPAFPAVLDVDVLVDHPAVERAGAVEGEDGDQVGEAVGLHLHEQVADARAVELEDALRLAALEELVRLLVVERQAEQVERLAELLLHQLRRRRPGW